MEGFTAAMASMSLTPVLGDTCAYAHTYFDFYYIRTCSPLSCVMLTLLVRRVPWIYMLLFVLIWCKFYCVLYVDWTDVIWAPTHIVLSSGTELVFLVCFACPMLCVSKHVLTREYLVCCLIIHSEAGLYTVPSSNYHVNCWHMHTVLVGCEKRMDCSATVWYMITVLLLEILSCGRNCCGLQIKGQTWKWGSLV